MFTKLLKTIKHYGVRHQVKKLNEEHGEVVEAIYDLLYFKENFLVTHEFLQEDYDKLIDHVAEEIADNLNLLKQFQLLFDIPEKQINKWREHKAERTIKEIKSK